MKFLAHLAIFSLVLRKINTEEDFKEPSLLLRYLRFCIKVFKGNKDSDTAVYNTLTPAVITRYIRFKPVEWHNRISMRIEIYGCPGM